MDLVNNSTVADKDEDRYKKLRRFTGLIELLPKDHELFSNKDFLVKALRLSDVGSYFIDKVPPEILKDKEILLAVAKYEPDLISTILGVICDAEMKKNPDPDGILGRNEVRDKVNKEILDQDFAVTLAENNPHALESILPMEYREDPRVVLAALKKEGSIASAYAFRFMGNEIREALKPEVIELLEKMIPENKDVK